MKNQLLLATLILIALPCLAVASREGGLASPEQSRRVTPYILGGGPIQHSPFNIHHSQTLPLVLDAQGGTPSAQLTPPLGAGPLKLTLETAFAEDPIDGLLFSIDDQLYGFETTEESNYLVQLDLASGEVLSREKLASPEQSRRVTPARHAVPEGRRKPATTLEKRTDDWQPSTSNKLTLYLTTDPQSGRLTLRTEPSSGLITPYVTGGGTSQTQYPVPTTQDDLVAFAPTIGRAIVFSLTHLDPSDLVQDHLPRDIPDNQLVRHSPSDGRITIQLVVRPVAAASENETLAKQSDMRNPRSAIDAPNASDAHLRTRELTVFHVTP